MVSKLVPNYVLDGPFRGQKRAPKPMSTNDPFGGPQKLKKNYPPLPRGPPSQAARRWELQRRSEAARHRRRGDALEHLFHGGSATSG